MGRPPLYDRRRLDAALEAAGVDALVLAGAPNVLYTTRYRRGGRALAVVCRGDSVRPLLIVPSSDADYVLEDVSDEVEVQAHGTFVRFHDEDVPAGERETLIRRVTSDARADADEFVLAAEQLRRAGLDRGRLWTDVALPRLEAGLPDARIESHPELMRRVRTVKTGEELRRLQAAATVAEDAIEATVGELRDGATQRELASVFSASVAEAGARVRMDNVSFGRSTAFGNANLPDDRLEHGSLVRFDVGAIVEGYASDLSRCFGFGPVAPRMARYYAALLAGQRAALEHVRPGATAAAIFEVAVQTVREHGIVHYERTNVGHGIGLFGEGYDPPLLAPSDATPLEPGMVLCVETPYYELGFGGLQVEDMVVVTESGFGYLTRLPRELRLVG